MVDAGSDSEPEVMLKPRGRGRPKAEPAAKAAKAEPRKAKAPPAAKAAKAELPKAKAAPKARAPKRSAVAAGVDVIVDDDGGDGGVAPDVAKPAAKAAKPAAPAAAAAPPAKKARAGPPWASGAPPGPVWRGRSGPRRPDPSRPTDRSVRFVRRPYRTGTTFPYGTRSPYPDPDRYGSDRNRYRWSNERVVWSRVVVGGSPPTYVDD
eukprot:TRINITY_DN4452_c1_g1_i1.p1 TRINITY_DN4452_c1_g1~~TRINITY_DN4452_c1_g1_i1.p1  ORF type:complete len:232 (+),score=34.81 TRINITY_DN4452_c1_g1_i1:77-697(+)